VQAVKRLLAAAASKDKELREFPEGYHELLMGPEKEEAARTVKEWILKHSPGLVRMTFIYHLQCEVSYLVTAELAISA
jgi:putative lipoic acid-binding regulatory protein